MYFAYCDREGFEGLFRSDYLCDLFHLECIFRMMEDDPNDMDVRLLYFEWLEKMKDNHAIW